MANISVQEIPDSRIATQKAPLDKRTLYETKNAFLTAPENAIAYGVTNRFIGQKVVIQADPENDGKPCEYWFKDGIADSDLVRYTFDDSYEWEPVKPGSGSGGGGLNLNGDPMQLVKGDGTYTPGFMEVRHTLDGIYSSIPTLPNCDGYIITMTADKLYATIYAAHGCDNLSFKIIQVSRSNTSSNFAGHGWVSFMKA